MLLLTLALLAADPASLKSVLNGAHAGDTIRLAAGRYPVVTIKARTFVPALTVDASAASVAGVRVVDSTGIAWRGGTIAGDVPADGVAVGFGLDAQNSADISVEGVRITGFKLGVGFGTVRGGRIAHNWLSAMSSDGIDVALSRGIVIDHNSCTGFAPAPGSHPDCIQLWSRPTAPPTADITITGNVALGALQGISLFNHVRDGVNDGGFDRIAIRGNRVLNIYPDGIVVDACRGCTVRDNVVDSLPNYEHRAQLFISGGSVAACGNVVPKVPRQGSPPCPS